MTNILSQTASLCPHCFLRIPAQKILQNGSVYLRKSCPLHGHLKDVLLWRNHPISYEAWARPHADAVPDFPVQTQNGCPYDCGLCSAHRQRTCTAIIEVTQRCDLGCPVCFASSKMNSPPDPGLDEIALILEMLREREKLCPIQISGGEPATRDDLPGIVALAKTMGFNHIQINTNGLRFSGDADFARSLADAGATVIYLQFDGLTDSVYKKIRGSELLAMKLRAVERCAELKLGLILVPAIVKNINDSQIGDLIQFAKKWIPVVKGIHFQPMTYLGRYPSAPRNEDRILIPDILTAIEDQTMGELKFENFLPSG